MRLIPSPRMGLPGSDGFRSGAGTIVLPVSGLPCRVRLWRRAGGGPPLTRRWGRACMPTEGVRSLRAALPPGRRRLPARLGCASSMSCRIRAGPSCRWRCLAAAPPVGDACRRAASRRARERRGRRTVDVRRGRFRRVQGRRGADLMGTAARRLARTDRGGPPCAATSQAIWAVPSAASMRGGPRSEEAEAGRGEPEGRRHARRPAGRR
jgi:hypothetical protein